MVRSKRRVLVGWVASGVSALVVLAACGSGGGTSADTGNGASPETSPSQSAASGPESSAKGNTDAPLGEVTVASTAKYALDEIGVAGAEEQGLWKNMGLTVKVVEAEDLGRAISSGSADIGIGSPTRLVGPMLDGTFTGVLVGPTTNKFLLAWALRPDLGTKDLADLKGKTFGISSFGSLGDLGVHLLANEQGWKESDYKEVALGGSDGLVAGLQRGSIDAFAWTPLLPYSLQGEGKAVAVRGSVADEFAPYASSALFASPQAIKDHPQDIKAFCKGFYDSQQAMTKDLDSITDLLIKGGGYTDSPSLREAVSTFAPDIATSSEMSDAMLSNILKATQISTGKYKDATVQDLAKHYMSCDSLG